MTMSDPIADMLTRIRNAQMVRQPEVVISASKLKMAIANVLVEEGYLQSVKTIEGLQPTLQLQLKYHNGKGVIESIKRISKPSLRQYVASKDIPSVMGGLGVVIMSTSKGVLTGAAAKKMGLGGEILCRVF